MTNVDLEHARAAVESYKYAKARINELRILEETSRAVIEEALGENEIGQLDGQTVITWAHVKKNQFQQKKMAEDHPEWVAEYTEMRESRTMKTL